MAVERSFVETIIAMLGTPREPFGLEELLAPGLLTIAGAAWIAFELGAASLAASLLRWIGTGDGGESPPPGRSPPGP